MSHPHQRYIAELDGVRALSVMSVIACHTLPSAPGGFVGVDIFFVLSGFLITRLLLAERDSHGEIGIASFYMRRALRLMPAFYTMLAAIVAFLLVTGTGDRLSFETVLASGFYLMNWTRAFGMGHDGFLGHTWSLAVEEQFYLLWPLLLVAILGRIARGTLPRAIAVLILGVMVWRCTLLLAGADPMRIYNGTDTRIDSLLVGALCASIRQPERSPLLGRLAAGSALLLALQIPFLSWQSAVLQSIGFTALAGLAGVVVLWAASSPSGASARLLRSAPFTGLGRISYGVYLWHYPLLMLFLPSLREHSPALVFVLISVGSVALAAISFLLVERPCLAIKQRLSRQAVMG